MTFLSSLANFLIEPFFWVLALVIAAFILPKERGRRIVAAAAILLMLLFSNPFLHRLTNLAWEPSPVAIREIAVPDPYDYGIVLGGFTHMYARPLDRLHLNNSANRFWQSLDLYHQGKIRTLVFVSGSTTSGKPPLSEAEMARDAAIRSGVPEKSVIALSKSRNTFENAQEFREFLTDNPNKGSLLLITSASHMPRALACFHKQGLHPDAFPTDHRSNHDPDAAVTLGSLLAPSPATFTAWRSLFREWLSLATYRLRGRI